MSDEMGPMEAWAERVSQCVIIDGEPGCFDGVPLDEALNYARGADATLAQVTQERDEARQAAESCHRMAERVIANRDAEIAETIAERDAARERAKGLAEALRGIAVWHTHRFVAVHHEHHEHGGILFYEECGGCDVTRTRWQQQPWRARDAGEAPPPPPPEPPRADPRLSGGGTWRGAR